MSDMFNAMYDEIFLNENNNKPLDNEKINLITKKYIDSKAHLNEKKNFLKLKKEYLKIISIENYVDVQEKLYSGKDKKGIVSLEIKRILNKGNDSEILEQVSNVERILDLYDDEDISDELYYRIVNGIIRLEISLGLKIGLFKELRLLFEKECNKIEEVSFVRSR